MDASLHPQSEHENDGLFPAAGGSGRESESTIPDIKSRLPSKAARRIRGEIACAECRRLKIRCDKSIPCSTCVKRGCAALCPNGTIPPGEGSRFVLAATDHLQRKMSRMEARMHALEDALAIIQADYSNEPHPLLSTPFDDFDESAPVLAEASDASALSDALGTLHIDRQGSARFFGPSGGSESLLLKAKDIEKHSLSRIPGPLLQDLDPSYLPKEINDCYQSFPFTPPNILVSAVQPMIEHFLPPMGHAVYLCDTFLEHLSWMFHIVSRRQMVDELIPILYKQTKSSYGPHDLALLFIVMGIGSFVDLNLEPYNPEAQHYHRLARAALALQPVLGDQSVVTIKVLHLMSIYNGLSGKESNLENSYVLLDLAGQVASRIGFHIDPALWGFTGKHAYDRRVYFWNLMAGILWQVPNHPNVYTFQSMITSDCQSLVTGRPPALQTDCIDCRIPSAEDENLFQRGEVPLGFGIWGFKASMECLIPLVKLTCGAKTPNYRAVLDLDRKIRNFVPPQPDEFSTDRTAVSMQTFVRSHYQDLMLLFLHRGFFAQAMTENPHGALRSSYGPSVIAAYTSACVVLDDTRTQYSKKPRLCARVWRIWSLAFSAAVIIGTVATRGTHLNLKPPAFEQFQAAYDLFKSACEISSRAARAMPILQIMMQKVLQSRESQYGDRSVVPIEPQPDDELSIFGGKARLVNPEEPFTSPPLYARSTPNDSLPEPRRVQIARGDEGLHSQNRQYIDKTTMPTGNNHLDALQASFADMNDGWNASYGAASMSTYGDGAPTHLPSFSYPMSEASETDGRWLSLSQNQANYNLHGYPSNPHFFS